MKGSHNQQQGLAMLILVFMIALTSTAYLLNIINVSSIKSERDKLTANTLAEAKSALIGFSIKENIADSARLPNPDLMLALLPEGSQAGAAGSINHSLVGRFPWRSLGTEPLRDGWGECLWYVVSGKFKTSPATTSVLNWDTLGQIDVLDKNGVVIASNLAAMVIASNSLLPGQDRVAFPAEPTPVCGGNYDARNYLDAYNAVNAMFGEVNYFQGSINNRAASNTNNKRFVQVRNDFYNDSFVFITTEDIYSRLIVRNEFSNQISALLNDPDFITIISEINISSEKGTGNLDLNCGCTIPSCSQARFISNSNNRDFCTNWKEMLLVTALASPTSIIIDGVSTPPCERVVIFGGQRIGLQSRLTALDKSNPANYLEGSNLDAFETPTAANDNFVGNSTFSASASSADVMRCI